MIKPDTDISLLYRQFQGLPDHLGLIAEALQPPDFGVPPEPGPLPLGILTRPGLGGKDGLLKRDLAANIPNRLPIAQRFEGFFVASCALRQQ